MRRYLISLIPFRWIIVVIFIICTEYMLVVGHFPGFYHLFNVVTWFVIDYTIGLGRSERSVWKNILGVFYLTVLIGYLWYTAVNMIHS